MPVGFCTLCNYQVEQFEGLSQCPQCGTTSKPCAYTDQVSIAINLHELRLLGIWAENWAARCNEKDIIYAIMNRIKNQLPDKSVPLTMREEFEQLKSSGVKFETNHPAADNPDTGESYKPTGLDR